MATNFTYATLTTAIQNYTEVTDTTTVFTSTITDGFITDAETRILRDVNIDADRKSQTGSLVVAILSIFENIFVILTLSSTIKIFMTLIKFDTIKIM